MLCGAGNSGIPIHRSGCSYFVLTVASTKLVATNGQRIEPISYWIKVGDKAVISALERKLIKIKQILTGRADSGMLARVSSIETDQVLAYKEQETFINAMLSAMPEEQRKRLVGDQQVELTIAKDMK